MGIYPFCQNELLNFCCPGPGMRGYEMVAIIKNGESNPIEISVLGF